MRFIWWTWFTEIKCVQKTNIVHKVPFQGTYGTHLISIQNSILFLSKVSFFFSIILCISIVDGVFSI